MAPPRDLDSPAPRPHDLENVKSHPRKLRPNFFLKATLLTFDGFKERFGRVHADLLEKSGGRVDGFATRGSCSACEANSQKGDPTSIRSKLSTSISRSVTSLKSITLTSSKYSTEKCLKGCDKPTKETREKHSKTKDLVLDSRADHNGFNVSTIDTSTSHVKYSESTNSQSESAFKTADVDLHGRCSKHSKSVTCSLGGQKPRHKEYSVAATSARTDVTRGCLRNTDSFGSSLTMEGTPKLSNFTKKCLDATQYKGSGYELCENMCEICNTSAVIDCVSGKLKRADSDRLHRPKRNRQRICSETSIIRSCMRAKRSGIGHTDAKKALDECIDKSETCSFASECERCSQTRLVERGHVEDITDDTNLVLASKAKMYGFDYADICDVSEPVNEFSNSDDECTDDIKHLNMRRYSNEAIDKAKMMIIRTQNKNTGGSFTLREGVSNILKPLKIMVRYFPVPPVNIKLDNKSPLDLLFRNEEINGIFDDKNVIDEDFSATDSIGQVSMTTSMILDKKYSHSSFWMGDSDCLLSSESSTAIYNDNVSEEEFSSMSDITQPEHNIPVSVSPSEKSCIHSIGKLGNYVHSGHIMKRNKSEPSIGRFRNQGCTLKTSVSDLMNVPSRFIPIRGYECFEPTGSQLLMDKTIFRVLSVPLIMYAGCLLGYPTLLLYLFDMLLGPDFTSTLYVVTGIIIAYVYMKWKNFRSVRNEEKWDSVLPEQTRNK